MVRAWENTPLRKGMEVLNRNGDKVGYVKEVLVGTQSGYERFFTIEKGFVLKHEHVVPREAIRSAEGNHVLLDLDHDAIQNLPEYEGRPPTEPEARAAYAHVHETTTMETLGRAGGEPTASRRGARSDEETRWAFTPEVCWVYTPEEAERRAWER